MLRVFGAARVLSASCTVPTGTGSAAAATAVSRSSATTHHAGRQHSTPLRLAPAYPAQRGFVTMDLAKTDLAEFPPERIRNFCIIAHIDHGKSSLADRLLDETGTLAGLGGSAQYLDKLKVEKERGITVKAQTASLFHQHQGETYLLNLIDTPGHVDFSYEVSRSMRACQGAVLVVDACQGVQAQTMAVYYAALAADLPILPVANKIDLPNADVDACAAEMKAAFGVDPASVLPVSAKAGINVCKLLDMIVEQVPPPPLHSSSPDAATTAFLFDSWYDEYRGVICLVELMDGTLSKGDRITFVGAEKRYQVLDIGLMYPEQVPVPRLHAGQVGYLIVGMKSTKEARVGDTIHHTGKPVPALPGFQPAKPMVFAGLYPASMTDFPLLDSALAKLTLNDSSVTISKESSSALGIGFRCGFLGLLHMDVFHQRLLDEYGADVIVTTPAVPSRVTMTSGQVQIIENALDWPDPAFIRRTEEPVIEATIVLPDRALGSLITLCEERRGQQLDLTYLAAGRAVLRYQLPLAEIVSDFYDQLKSRSQGYATLDYELAGWQATPLVKLVVMLNAEPVDALSCIVPSVSAQSIGRRVTARLKDVIARQQFEVAIQAAVGGKILARETIRAFRKDVTAKLYGGDVTRKKKLLEKQKAGKRRMKQVGRVELDPAVFRVFLSSNQGSSK